MEIELGLFIFFTGLFILFVYLLQYGWGLPIIAAIIVFLLWFMKKTIDDALKK